MGQDTDAHEVEMRAYEFGRYPVTVEEFGKYLKEGGCEPHNWESQTLTRTGR